MNNDNGACPDCDHDFSRRDFVKAAGAAALTLGAVPFLPRAFAAPTSKSPAETAVGRFYNTLSDEQKKEICFPFNHQLRKKINANWSVTEPRIEDDFYTDEQRKLTREIVKAITSEDGFDRFEEQMEDDAGGFDKYHLAKTSFP